MRFIIFSTFFFLIIINNTQIANAQNNVNYFEIKSEIKKTSCTEHTIEAVNETVKALLAIDTNAISKGLSEYYYDLGMAYYMKSEGFKETEFRELSIKYFLKCLEKDKKKSNAYLNISLIYFINNMYDKAKIYLKLYKKNTPKKYWDLETIETIEKSVK